MKPVPTGGLRRMLVLLAAVFGVVLTASLGQWQLGRAAQKQALLDAHAAQRALPPLDASSLTLALDTPAQHPQWWHRAVVLQGQWLAQHTVYLDNRAQGSQAGLIVVTPLQLTHGPVVLVQRGWAPRNFMDRQALPSVPSPSGPVQVLGRLAPWPSRIYDFGGADHGALRQNLDWAAFRAETGLPLLSVSVQQEQGDDALRRAWPVVAAGVEKHHGYAFQWFGLSALIAFLYVWFQIVRPRRSTAAPPTPR